MANRFWTKNSEHLLKTNSTIFWINISFNDKNRQQYSPIRTTFDNFIIWLRFAIENYRVPPHSWWCCVALIGIHTKHNKKMSHFPQNCVEVLCLKGVRSACHVILFGVLRPLIVISHTHILICRAFRKFYDTCLVLPIKWNQCSVTISLIELQHVYVILLTLFYILNCLKSWVISLIGINNLKDCDATA